MHSKLPRKNSTRREVSPTVGTFDSADRVLKTSLRDQAALLLSISDIAQSEITTCPMALSNDSSFPRFPAWNGGASKFLTPRTESLRGLLYDANIGLKPTRLRTVSIDSPAQFLSMGFRTPSPLSSPPVLALDLVESSPMKPIVRRLTHRSARLSHKARHERVREGDKKRETIPPVFVTPPKFKALQGKPPEGVTIKKILRRKFSWKNYTEVGL